jgi:hypothetical protein
MIRCIRLWSGTDHQSHFEEGWIELNQGAKSDLVSSTFATAKSFFQQTASGGSLDWHTAPFRQLVITLSGTLDFQTREGAHFQLEPGKVLLAEDTVGSGHSWKLIGADPWCRLYVILEKGVVIPFHKKL